MPARQGADIETHLSRVLGYDVMVAVYMGPRRAVEKPVLQVLSPRGRTVAFAKLGTNDLTRALIRTEVATLERLAATQHVVLDMPRILHAGSWQGHELIVQGAVLGGDSKPPTVPLVGEAIREVAAVGGVALHEWASSPYRVELRERVRALADSPHQPPLEEALTALDDLAGGAAMRLGATHGDWAPWNMTQRGDRLTVWDWEHWRSGVPVGFDAVHHDLSRSVVLQSATPLAAIRAILDGVDSALTDQFAAQARAALVTAYVIDIATRYIEDGEDAVGGTPLSRLGEWLEPALRICRSALRYERVADAVS